MSKRLAALAATAVLFLGGCGHQAPAAAFRAPVQAAAAHKAPSLADLMQQAKAIVGQNNPNCAVYEVSGKCGNSELVDVGDVASWTFGVLDDADHPTSTFYLVYKNGKFGAPVQKAGYDFGRHLEDLDPRLTLREAVLALRQAGYKQDFRYVDLYKVINPAYNQPLFVFSAETAIVTVGGNDGVVSNHRPQDWPWHHGGMPSR
ncbi:MAG: hypothetical protein JWM80_3443 [Cyanobacteria bacterium RYN_339]|nr:hypothetical protein [Cyanobacteria bacterium RYN_339]